MTDPWFDDSEQVASDDQLLRKSVVFIRLEGDSEQPHNARVRGETERDTVLTQESLQFG